MKKTLQQHLEESNMTYQQHLGHSVRQSNRLIVLAVKSYIHGLLPWFFVNDGPLGVYRIYKEIRHMHHVQKLFNREDHDQS